MFVHQQFVARWGRWVSKESPNKAETRCFFLFLFGERKQKEQNRETNWFCNFIHFCAISPHATAAEDQAGAAAWAFCCARGFAANQAHTIATVTTLWERSSSSEVPRRALYWPPWRSVWEILFFFLQAKWGAITKFLAESAASYDSASSPPGENELVWGVENRGMKRTEMKVGSE